MGAVLVGTGALPAMAQSNHSECSVEVGMTFAAQHALQVGNGDTFWAEGGSVELGVNAFHGFGIAANITAIQTSSINATGVPLTLVTETFGPRYRWHDGARVSVYAEGLVGEANAFNSLFPSVFGAQTDANALASRAGGGVDLRLGHHLSARMLEAAWQRTQLPNSAADVQNNLHLGAGLVFRFVR